MIQIKARRFPASDTRAMPKHPLTRDLIVVLIIKLTVVIAAAMFVFSPGQRPKIGVDSIATRLIDATDASFERGVEP